MLRKRSLPLTKVSLHLSTRNVDITHTRGRTLGRITEGRNDQHGKIFHLVITRKAKGNNSFHHDQPRASSRINDNHCVTRVQPRLLAGSLSPLPRQTMNTQLSCCHGCLYCPRAFTKERYKSWGSRLSIEKLQIKICEKCFLCYSIVLCKSCLKSNQCCTQSTCRGQTSKFLANLAGNGCRTESGSNLERGLHLPFRIRPKLTRSPTVISCYVNPHRNSYLLEALHQLMNKKAIELVHNQTSLGFFNRLFLVPKPNNKWRPILDLSKLNLFLKVEKFKMETPETIRTSLQQGEWVTSVDFKDAYFHIPIQEQSRKYLRFHVQGRTYQFKALPFGLSTAPMEFTVLAKEVKLMAIHKGIRIHQYLDDWLVRARSHRICLQHTQALVKMCQDLG